MKGSIKSVINKKKFGFIKCPDNREFFFHYEDFNGHWNDLSDDYDAGQYIEVEFIEDKTDKGLRARNVRRLDYPNQAA